MTEPTPPIALRMTDIRPFQVMELLARARQLEAAGRTIVHMEIGEPDFPSPQPVVEAGLRAVKSGEIHYTPSAGLSELREAIAKSYADRYGADVDPARIIITPGSSGALLLIMGVLVNPGAEVLLTDPGYPANRNFVLFAGGVPRGLPVEAATGYQFSPEMLEAAWGPKTVSGIIATPSNPTGTVVPTPALKRMIDFAAARGGRLIIDEIYHGLVYEGGVETALNLSESVFVMNSFSKYYGMTGWRIGWLVAPKDFVREAEKLAQNIFISAPSPAQYAALAAFSPETTAILEERRAEFRRRRDFLVPALRELGFGIPVTPEGAFYLYADCSALAEDSFAFCRDALERAGVAFTPGMDFGTHLAGRHVRFAYTTSMAQIEEGVERLRRFLR